ncbi:phosphatidylethanolamine-binding protein 4 isoform X3 [Pelodiscus sinensis]|uniref:phosphatidylethanolamine-binding protein 4 isoform X3 n=1 Tax=Pelodiscus sinensis TaxID=13735 RepID=UPI003F6A69DE
MTRHCMKSKQRAQCEQLQQVRMKLLAVVALVAGLAGVAARGGDEHVETCVFEKLSGQDAKFCRGDLEVFYPELGDVGCTYIPKCNQYRKRISKEWSRPQIVYPQADKTRLWNGHEAKAQVWESGLQGSISPLQLWNKKYVLIMADPDAPSRANPKYRFWRHWVVIDIKGIDLRAGNLKGRVLTEYGRPTPPSRSGYHRYQFRLYEQPAHEAIALSPEEEASLGSWPLERFVERFRLGSPAAATQFLTQHPSD